MLEPSITYVHNWHIDVICDHLEAVTRGEITRLLINVPPGSMKSMLVSVLWPAWEWGPNGLRSLRYLATAFNDGPVKRDTRKCRDLILSDWYQALWPEVRLTRTAEMSFANSDTGTREGVAFGSLTSQRGDRVLIDDPHSTDTVESKTERDNATRKFRERAIFSVNDPKRSAVIVIMQRLHEDDVSGIILKYGMEFVHICLPMEFEPDRRCVTPLGVVDIRQADGELLDPERAPPTYIEKLKRDSTSYAWAGQFQQRPAPREGGMFKRFWFGPPLPAAPAGLQRVRSWDLAATVGGGDWTVGVLMGRDAAGFFYILDVVRIRGSAHDVEQLIIATAGTDGRAVKVRIPQDGGQAGKGQSEYLTRALAGYTVIVERETGSKETRAMPLASQCEARNVRLIIGLWIEVFLTEIEVFPMGGHDDQVDAASGAFMELAGRPKPMVFSADFLRRAAQPARRHA